jgi:hypothetical protein
MIPAATPHDPLTVSPHVPGGASRTPARKLAHRIIPTWLVAYQPKTASPRGKSPDGGPHRNAKPHTNGGTRAAMNPHRSRPTRSHADPNVTAPHTTHSRRPTADVREPCEEFQAAWVG